MPNRKKEFRLRVSARVKEELSKVGSPEKEPFRPDPFQVEAVEELSRADVLVSAPTGSGKTWIAVQAMERVFNRGGRVWYASPLKALSNAKYREFQEYFGPDQVGILTGDRKENASAPILVGTTEIFRNHLYDAMHRGEDLMVDLVVLDEAHFLGDPDRGMVWEEILIYLPPRIRLLMLSATVSNAEEIAAWLRTIRGSETRVVRASERPVPLYSLFLFPDGRLVPLLKGETLNPKVREFEESRKGSRYRMPGISVPWVRVLDSLRKLNLLPAIFFLKSRSDCNTAVSLCTTPPARDPARDERFREHVERLLEEMPFLRDHPQLPILKRFRVAAHHGGQLPHWKLLVESLMKEGLIEAIFATSTVAAGVNFPARTVAFMNSDRFNGRTFQNLTSTELHQMLGRAGRRGMDRIGFALVLPGPYQRPALVAELLRSEPEPIMSQMRLTFSMALNLLLSHAPEEVRELLKQSLFLFQNTSNLLEMEKELEALARELEAEIPDPRCGGLKEMLRRMGQQRELVHRQRFLTRRLKADRLKWFRRSHLVRGRVFMSRKRKLFCVIDPPDLKEGDLFRAVPVGPALRSRKGRLKTREFHLRRIGPLLACVVDLPEDMDPKTLGERLRNSVPEECEPLPVNTPLHPHYRDKLVDMEEELRSIRETLKRMPCRECRFSNLCHGRERPEWRVRADQAAELVKRIDAEKEGIWLDFKRHLRFLQETDFVDAHGALTEDGMWAARLRLDQPLLVAEAIRKNLLPDHNPVLLAALMSVFVWERRGDTDLPEGWIKGDKELRRCFEELVRETVEFRERMEQNGFSTPPFLYRPAVTLFSWASGAQWGETCYLAGMDEGDLAMLIYRTADNLRQLIDLKESHPRLSGAAVEAVGLILREPVLPY